MFSAVHFNSGCVDALVSTSAQLKWHVSRFPPRRVLSPPAPLLIPLHYTLSDPQPGVSGRI